MHSISNATLQLALIAIPVKVYPAASAVQMGFNWLSKKGHRVSQKLIDSYTTEELSRADVQNGYEIEKDKFIIFSQEELTLIKKHKTGDYIEICEAVKQINLSPSVVEKSYYLYPNKSDHSYLTLYHSLRLTRKVLVAKWYRANKDNLVVIEVGENILMMYQLYYTDELKTFEPSYAKNSEPSREELRLGKLLIEQISSDGFDLTKYKDEYRNRLMAAIEQKKAGQVIFSEKQIEQGQELLDLAGQLKKSLEKK